MAAEGLASDVLGDTAGVGLKVLIDSEGNREGALGHELLLHSSLALDSVRRGGEVLVLGEGGSVARLVASGSALGGGVLGESIASNHAGGRGDVVSARSQGVGSAGGALAHIGIVTTSDNTGLYEPVPGSRWLATVATHRHGALEASAARNSVLRGEQLGVVTGLDAVSVIESLGRTEGPATSNKIRKKMRIHKKERK